MLPRSIRAVLFDLDDTLTDRSATVAAYAIRFAEGFRERLQVVDAVVIAQQLAVADRDGYNPQRASDEARLPIWRSAPAPAELALHWSEHFPACTVLRAACHRTLEELRVAGLRLGVVTNGGSLVQRKKLEVTGLDQMVDVVVISEEVKLEKPDPRIFAHAAECLLVPAAQCLFIGDNPRKDVQGAGDFGMHAAWLRASLEWPEDLERPRHQLGSLDGVLELLVNDEQPFS